MPFYFPTSLYIFLIITYSHSPLILVYAVGLSANENKANTNPNMKQTFKVSFSAFN